MCTTLMIWNRILPSQGFGFGQYLPYVLELYNALPMVWNWTIPSYVLELCNAFLMVWNWTISSLCFGIVQCLHCVGIGNYLPYVLELYNTFLMVWNWTIPSLYFWIVQCLLYVLELDTDFSMAWHCTILPHWFCMVQYHLNVLYVSQRSAVYFVNYANIACLDCIHKNECLYI